MKEVEEDINKRKNISYSCNERIYFKDILKERLRIYPFIQ